MQTANHLVDRNEIGPFPGHVKPARPGMYKRISKKGNVVYAYWNGEFWGLFSSNKRRAMDRAHKRSKKRLPWIGRAKK